MAVAAEVTSTLRIGCRMFCVGYHHAYVLAKEIATLAELSGGRTEVGLGAGWLEAEYAAMGIPFPPAGERVTHLAEFLAMVKDFLAGRPAATDGTHVRVRDMSPLPLLPAPPPIMVGGGAPRVLRLAGAQADIVSINFNNRSGVIGADSVASSGHDETVKKLGWVREGAGERYDDVELEFAAYFLAVDGGDTTEQQLTASTGLAGDDLRTFPHALVGLGRRGLRGAGAPARALRLQLRHHRRPGRRGLRPGGRAAQRALSAAGSAGPSGRGPAARPRPRLGRRHPVDGVADQPPVARDGEGRRAVTGLHVDDGAGRGGGGPGDQVAGRRVTGAVRGGVRTVEDVLVRGHERAGSTVGVVAQQRHDLVLEHRAAVQLVGQRQRVDARADRVSRGDAVAPCRR